MTLNVISEHYHAIAEKLAASPRHVHFFTTPQHDGSWHVERNANEFHYVVTERGIEIQRRKASDAEEILFWLVSDLTFRMATEWEVEHRIEGQDFRRQLFRKQVELISSVSEEWARRTMNLQDSRQESILRSNRRVTIGE